jgi:AAA family ATP:ADP antiporter
MNGTARLNRFERCLTLFTRIDPGDGTHVAALGLQALTLMIAYYLLRPVREALILTEGGAVLRSYAVGMQAIVLIALVPLYGALVRRVGARRVLGALALLAALQLALFGAAGFAGGRIGFPFFIWVGIFGVLMVAQFWALASDLLSVESGQRLFGVIAAAITAGAWLGARIAADAFPLLGPYGLMLASGLMLVVTAFINFTIVNRAQEPTAPASGSGTHAQSADLSIHRLFGGLALVASTPYLTGIAAIVVLLNWITSTGEFVLSDWLAQIAHGRAPGEERAFIGQYMGAYGALIALLGFLVQLLGVSHTIRFAGLARALLVTPLVFVAGYLAVGVIPVFAVLQCVMITQKSLDYSLFSTTRSALLLPAGRAAKFQAKTAIDTVFYRLGDLLATLTVFVGVRMFGASGRELLGLTLALSVALAIAAWAVGRGHAGRVAEYDRPALLHGGTDDDRGGKDRTSGQPAFPRSFAAGARADRCARRAAAIPRRRDHLFAGRPW